MNHRKRRADEQLLPFRSAKQPRTTLQGYSGGTPSPSQFQGILSRWLSLGRETWRLGCDTFFHIVQGPTDCESIPFSNPRQPRWPLPPPPPSPPPRRSSVPPRFRRTMSRSPSPPQSSAPQLPEYTLTTNTNGLPLRSTGSMSASAISGTAPSYIGSSYPQLDEALAASQRQIANNFSDGIKRKYQNREHIYAKTHKANVQVERKKVREEMQKELYRYRRSSGYTQDFPTFLGYLSYKATLEKFARREALSPSPSLTNLRSKPHLPTRSRRHSHSCDDRDFLERTLEKARATLNGPKPPKPFNPSLDQLQISHRAKDDEIERRLRGPKSVPLPSSLPPEDDAKVDAILKQRGVVSKFAREQVTDQDLSRLRPHQWVNDEIINFYGAMILARSDECKENPGVNGVNGVTSGKTKPLNVHYFSTFFWSKLKGEGYEKGRLAKWTKKLDIFHKDIALVPVNHNNSHWTGAAINFRRKRIESYDSMGMERANVFKLLRLYLDAEHRNKKKKPFDFTGWEDYTLEDTPQQENGFDCGVFICQFLEALSRGEELFNFTQTDMTYLRRRMIWEIGNGRLRDDS